MQTTYESRDEQKRLACSMAGITLIEIPFWWENDFNSVAATLRQKRPELVPFDLPANAIPLDLIPPSVISEQISNGFMLAQIYYDSMDPIGW